MSRLDALKRNTELAGKTTPDQEKPVAKKPAKSPAVPAEPSVEKKQTRTRSQKKKTAAKGKGTRGRPSTRKPEDIPAWQQNKTQLGGWFEIELADRIKACVAHPRSKYNDLIDLLVDGAEMALKAEEVELKKLGKA